MYQFLLFLIPLFTLFLGLIVLLKSSKNGTNILFFLMTTSMSIWMVFNASVDMSDNIETVNLLTKLDFSMASLMVFFFTLFCINFPTIKQKILIKAILFSILPIIFAFLALYTSLVVKGAYFVNGGYDIQYGILEYFYNAFIIFYVIFGVISLYLQYKKTVGLEKVQISVMFIGLFVMAILVTSLNLFGSNIFPNIPTINRFGFLGFAIFISFTAYAIIKKHLFDIKVILTETATVMVVIALIIQILISRDTSVVIINIVVLILVAYGGYLLIKSVQEEIKKKEQLQKLSTQLEQANQHLKELDSMKTEFVSLASHELLTPVSAIEGYLSMLLDEKMAKVEDPKAMRYLDNVYKSAKRLARLIADMLNISRIEEGRLLVEKTDMNVTEMIQEVIDEVKFKAEERHQKIEFKPDGWESYADPDKFKEVVINIVGNSIKYSKGPGTILVEVKRVPTTEVKAVWQKIEDEIKGRPLDDQEAIKSAVDPHFRDLVGDQQLLISVKDDGIGIPKEELPRLFKKFHRVGNYSTQESQGTGLGLYISRALIELQHGRIWADSEGEGKGSTFSFTLPDISVKPQILELEKQVPQDKEQLKPLAKPMKSAAEEL